MWWSAGCRICWRQCNYAGESFADGRRLQAASHFAHHLRGHHTIATRIARETNFQRRSEEDGLGLAIGIVGEAKPRPAFPAREGGGIDAGDWAAQLQPLARQTPQCTEHLAMDGLNTGIVGNELPNRVGGKHGIRLPRRPRRLARAGQSDQHDESHVERACGPRLSFNHSRPNYAVYTRGEWRAIAAFSARSHGWSSRRRSATAKRSDTRGASVTPSETGVLAASAGKPRHLAVAEPPKRSTLRYANKHRPWRLYRAVFAGLLQRCRRETPTWSPGRPAHRLCAVCFRSAHSMSPTIWTAAIFNRPIRI